MTLEEKNTIIDRVQDRIDQWIGRPYMYVNEATFLKGKAYPFKIKVQGIGGVLYSSLNQKEPIYSAIHRLISSNNSMQAENELFQHVVENYLTYCFGG